MTPIAEKLKDLPDIIRIDGEVFTRVWAKIPVREGHEGLVYAGPSHGYISMLRASGLDMLHCDLCGILCTSNHMEGIRAGLVSDYESDKIRVCGMCCEQVAFSWFLANRSSSRRRMHVTSLSAYADKYGDTYPYCDLQIEPRLFRKCNGCGSEHHHVLGRINSVYVSAKSVGIDKEVHSCKSCRMDYETCSSSGRLIPNEVEPIKDEYGNIYHPEEFPFVKDWNFKPRSNHFRIDDKDGVGLETFFGVELEVNVPNNTEDPRHYGHVANSIFGSDAYLKHDGSVGFGFEVVTKPMSLLYHKSYGWRDRLKKASHKGFSSYANGACGLHIHVSKNALTPIQWWKVMQFMSHGSSWRKVVKFSKRNSSQISRWCKHFDFGDVRTAKIMKQDNAVHKIEDRYVALNVTDHTVEFRIFRGTLKYDRLFSSILFCDALVQMAREIGIGAFATQDPWDLFMDFISKNQLYNTLHTYLIQMDKVGVKKPKKKLVSVEGVGSIPVDSWMREAIDTAIERTANEVIEREADDMTIRDAEENEQLQEGILPQIRRASTSEPIHHNQDYINWFYSTFNINPNNPSSSDE